MFVENHSSKLKQLSIQFKPLLKHSRAGRCKQSMRKVRKFMHGHFELYGQRSSIPPKNAYAILILFVYRRVVYYNHTLSADTKGIEIKSSYIRVCKFIYIVH